MDDMHTMDPTGEAHRSRNARSASEGRRRPPLAALAPAAFLALLAGGSASAQPSAVADLARLKPFQAMRESSSNADLAKNGDARSIAPGETLVLGELEGPGTVTHIWCTVAAEDPFYGRSLVLRIYWDGSESPSVVAPLGDFFGVGHGAFADYESAMSSVGSFGRARNCWWPMPFRTKARIEVANESSEYKVDSFYYYLDWRRDDAPAEDLAYFHAQYRQDVPARPGLYTLLDARGRGHYVGTVYSAQQVETGWYGEGDDFFTIDGEARPSMRGTGTEDYFGDAWGFRKFSTPYYGVSLWEGYFPGDRSTAYRWHVLDPIPFRESLKVEIEHRGSVFTDFGINLGQFIERPDHVSSVAFWYQTPPAALDPALPPVAERVGPYRVPKGDELTIRADPPTGLTREKHGALYLAGAPDAKLEVEFEIAEKGRWSIGAFLVRGIVGARYQPFLDDRELGPELDLFYEGMDPVFTRFDLHDLNPGKHVLRFEGRGASPKKRTKSPPVYAVGFTHLLLLRLEDMAGYREALRGAMKPE